MATEDRAHRKGLIKEITAVSNQHIKDIRALERRRIRNQTGLFMAEGLQLVAFAVEAGWEVETLVYAKNIKTQPLVQQVAAKVHARGGLILEVSEQVLSKLTHRDNPQHVIGVFKQRYGELRQLSQIDGDMVVALEGIKDPGNLGTTIRTADAVGASAILLIGETTDPFSLEAVRATMGSVFHLDIYKCTREEFLSWRKSWPGDIVGTHLKGAVDYRKVSPKEPLMVMMGNEQSGLPDNMAESCNHLVKIPMAGKAESLNLAVSVGITLFRLRESKLGL
ncbi:TrmH family RNA methyltransferase [Cohaesibacter gelatinilyticus]|uniref:RNA methyltransferase, TrmH family n=1 Tax=Cohaesibacter gelatinilyticus TaxID=372072 RepID=A0A285PFT8_9HYPH|nr:RNA methyltransferase [Cohaesibacter gelatinilyticus]SNZ20582.1 RNA methyltransferase, TrmH family [Cohaesibacter gelatinilyticus]